MGHRLTQIATRTGDDGTTGLGTGERVVKTHARIEAMGDVDELNSHLGVLLCEPLLDDVRQLLIKIQHQLFLVGGEISMPGASLLQEESLADLDHALAHYNAALPPLKEFILPGGTRSAGLAHVCRAVARRAERSVLKIGEDDAALRPALRQYLNRLSDLLFVLARTLNRANLDGLGGDDVYWQSLRLQTNLNDSSAA